MAIVKKKTRRKLSKQLGKLVKRHGAEMALALVTGIVSALATDAEDKAQRKERARTDKRPVRTIVVRKRA